MSLDVNFNESLTINVVSFEQLGPGVHYNTVHNAAFDIMSLESNSAIITQELH